MPGLVIIDTIPFEVGTSFTSSRKVPEESIRRLLPETLAKFTAKARKNVFIIVRMQVIN